MLNTRWRLPVLVSKILHFAPEFLWLVNTWYLIVLCCIYAGVHSSAEGDNKFQHVSGCAV